MTAGTGQQGVPVANRLYQEIDDFVPEVDAVIGTLVEVQKKRHPGQGHHTVGYAPRTGGLMRILPLFVLASGCYAQVALNGIGPDGQVVDGGAGATGSLDTDGDGVTDAVEKEIGTDPKLADTDADTYPDGEEVAANADPLDPDHHPYIGGWPIGACHADIAGGTGIDEGDIADTFSLLDQFGENVHLYDFCDRTALLIFAAFW